MKPIREFLLHFYMIQQTCKINYSQVNKFRHQYKASAEYPSKHCTDYIYPYAKNLSYEILHI